MSIYTAVLSGDVADVRRRIKNGEVDKPDDHGMTALMHAAAAGRIALVRLLITAGAAGRIARNGWTALMYAADGNHIDVVRMLIAVGEANRNAERWDSALLIAASQRHMEIAQLLIEAGEDPFIPTPHRVTPARMLGIKHTQPASLQMLCYPRIRYRRRLIGLYHPDLPPAMRAGLYET